MYKKLILLRQNKVCGKVQGFKFYRFSCLNILQTFLKGGVMELKKHLNAALKMEGHYYSLMTEGIAQIMIIESGFEICPGSLAFS